MKCTGRRGGVFDFADKDRAGRRFVTLARLPSTACHCCHIPT
jgi:hypothetical protein